MKPMIAVTNQKGGVGKTTTTLNLGGTIALTTNLKVLICDCDPQSNVALYSKLHKQPAFEFIFTDKLDSEGLWKRVQRMEGMENLYLMTCGKEAIISVNNKIAVMERDGKSENYLKERMEVFSAFFDQFDIIIFDLPPSHGPLSSNVYGAVDYVIGPTMAINGALDGIASLVDDLDRYSMKERKRKILGIVQTQYIVEASNKPKNARLFEALMDEKCQELKIDIIGRIRRDEAVNEANAGVPSSHPVLCIYDPKSRAAQDYLALTYSVLTRLGIAPVNKEAING